MNRLAELRAKMGITMKEAASRLEMPYTTYVNYEKGTREPNSETLIKLSRFFGTSIDDLICKSSKDTIIPPGFEPLPRMVKKPLIGDIACGEPITAEQNIADYVDVPESVHCDFCLRCHGDSMVEAGIQDSDVVYIRCQPQVEDGEIAAVRFGGEATPKRVYYDGQSLSLMPANSSYRPKTYTGPELDNIRIEGKAVGFTHWF